MWDELKWIKGKSNGYLMKKTKQILVEEITIWIRSYRVGVFKFSDSVQLFKPQFPNLLNVVNNDFSSMSLKFKMKIK